MRDEDREGNNFIDNHEVIIRKRGNIFLVNL